MLLKGLSRRVSLNEDTAVFSENDHLTFYVDAVKLASEKTK